MTIATDLISGILKTRYETEVNDASNRIQGFSLDWAATGTDITGLVSGFSRTTDIDSKLRSFEYNARSYIMNFDKPNSDSDVLDSLRRIGRAIDCVAADPELLSVLGITNWDEINDMVTLPVKFIRWITRFSLSSIFNNVITDNPHPEFEIGSKLSTIKSNSKLMDLTNLLIRVNYLVTCLNNSFNLDMSSELTTINGYLYDVYLTSTGATDWSRMSSLPTTDITNIKSVQKTSDFIVKGTENNFNRRLGDNAKKLFSDSSLLT